VENVTTGVEPVEVTDAEEVVTTVALEVAVAALEEETVHGFEAEEVATVAEEVATVSLEVTSAALEEEATVK
jgi:hypothetical protein